MTARRHLGLVAGFALAWLSVGAAGQGQQAQGQQGQQAQQGRGGAAQGQAGRGGANRDPTQQTQPVGTGAISGNVILEGAGSPVRRARVMLAGAELRGQRTAMTDDQGRFTFTALPAGRFTMTASKTGYIDTAYGAKQAGRPGTPIQLADAQTIEKLSIRVPKGSVVTGIVVDEHGEPSPMTQVRVMRFVLRTGEKTLQQSGQGGVTDDRGIYRIYGLQPGDYLVSATPRNANLGDLQQTIAATIASLTAQAQAAGGAAPGGGGRGGGGAGPGGQGLGPLLGGRGGQQYLDQISQLQQQQAQNQQDQAVGYAPVYYPGTPAPSAATKLTLSVGEERAGIDFQLMLVPTAKVEGTLTNPAGKSIQGAQVVLAPMNQGMPNIPGVGSNMARVGADGKFSFSNVTPGQYTISARAIQPAAVDASQTQTTAAQAGQPGQRGARGGPGGPGGPFGRGGAGGDVLWASADVTVSGQNLSDVALTLQEGMTISGRVEFRGQAAQPPTDLTTVRVNVTPQGQQLLDIGPGVQPAQVDANGTFTVKGVPPGKYVVRANIAAGGGRGGFGGAGGAATGAGGAGATGATGAAAAAGGGRGGGGGAAPAGAGGAPSATQGGSWTLKASVVNGRDTLDFPLELRPNENPSGVLLTFTDQTQTLSGTLQDATGRPTPDFTIIVFAADKQYWTPQARRIASTRPGTDGKYTFRGLPPGDYRITAVTDVEPGEWYDPAFLAQLANASIPVTLGEGQTKTQDLKLAGGGT
jgi:protocatechuate 3,4-dioxygenase beta subunit